MDYVWNVQQQLCNKILCLFVMNEITIVKSSIMYCLMEMKLKVF